MARKPSGRSARAGGPVRGSKKAFKAGKSLGLRRARGARPATASGGTAKPARRKKPAGGTRAVAKRPAGGSRKRTAARAAATPAVRPVGLFGPVAGAERRDIGHVQLEVGRAGAARVKRLIYPVGFRWSKDMKPAIGGDYCQHAHVGFLAHGEIHIEYPDGCIIEHRAPHVICIEPGHDGWVVGDEPVVMIEIDFEGSTVERLGMPGAHAH